VQSGKTVGLKWDVQYLLANNREAIIRNFKKEVSKDKHIAADKAKYVSLSFEATDEVSLCRATRWDRGVEGAEPWGITLQINTYEREWEDDDEVLIEGPI
jgi:hypothetical protein